MSWITRLALKTVWVWAAVVLAAPTLAVAEPPLTEWTSREEAMGHVDADLPLRPVPPRLHEQRGPQVAPIVRRVTDEGDQGPRPLKGSLSGASIYLSPGHGWVYSPGSWGTQRPNLYAINEDLSNADGESLPTPTLAIKLPAGGGKVPALLVTAADRAVADMNPQVTYTKLGKVDRLFAGRINSGDYLVQHGRALAGANLTGFDACTGDAVESGNMNPAGYKLVIWQGGRGVNGGRGVSTQARAALDVAAKAGVSIIISGSRVARTLGGTGATSADKALLNQTLGATFGASTSLYSGASATSNGSLAGLQPWTLGTLTSGPYEVGIPDVVLATAGGALAAIYTAGMGAVTQRRASPGHCGVLLGFPLEGVLPATRQGQILSRLVAYCLPTAPPPDGAPRPDGPRLDGSVPKPDRGSEDGAGPAPDKNKPLPDTSALELVLYGGSGCAAAPGPTPTWSLGLLLILLVVRRRLLG